CSAYRRGESFGNPLPQLGTLEIEMRKLPGDVGVDHGVEVLTRDRVVDGSPPLGGVECTAKTLPRHSYTGVGVQRREAIEPMEPVAVERAAHIEEYCLYGANHPLGLSLPQQSRGIGHPRDAARSRAPPARRSSE